MGALLGGHGGHQRAHRLLAGGHLCEQFVEIARLVGEEIPELLHEFLETRVLPALAPVDHLVECGEHLLHAFQVLGAGSLHALAHGVDELLHRLLAQFLHEFLEATFGLGRGKIVGLQRLDLARQVVGKQVEPEVTLGGLLARGGGPALVARILGRCRLVVDAESLLGHDVGQCLGDLGPDSVEVPRLFQLAAPLPESLEHLPQSLDPPTVPVLHPLAHEGTQRLVDVAMAHDVVGDAGEHVLGIHGKSRLGPVPAGIGETRGHGRNLVLYVGGRMRVPRTFVFVDISGFTNFTTSQGDDAAGRLLASWRAVTRDVASDTGVRIAKWLGDGCMVVAVDQRDAVTFALELQKRSGAACAPLSIRVGMASGLALLFEGDDYIGTAVNMAARLCDAAEPLEVIIPAEQVEDLPEGVVAIPHAPLSLRGLPEAIEVVTLSGEATNAARNDTGELWTRSPFVL